MVAAPIPAGELMREAQSCLVERRFNAAEQICRRLLEAQPRDVRAMQFLAECRQMQGDVAGAVRQLQKALEIAPEDPPLHLSLGNAWRLSGRPDEALASYQRAGELDVNLLDAHYNLALLLHEFGRHLEALKRLELVVGPAPQHAEAFCLAGDCLQALGCFDEALGCYGRALQSRPGYGDARANLGAALQSLRRFDEALVQFDNVLQATPGHVGALVNSTMILVERGALAEALEISDHALSQDERQAEFWYHRGRVLARLQRHQEALAAYARASELDPRHEGAGLESAITLAQLGRGAQALAVLDARLSSAPSEAGTWTTRGFVSGLLGNLDAARASYARALELAPGRADAVFQSACLDLLQGRWREGWVGYEARWDDPGTRLRRRRVGYPPWDLQAPLQGRTLFVFAEQGYGDTLQFCRFLPALQERGARVLFEAPIPLMGLMRRSLPEGMHVLPAGGPVPQADFYLPLLSTALACAATPETVATAGPYLRADAERCAIWSMRLGRRQGLRVGLAWSGNPAQVNDGRRSIPLARIWLALSTLSDDIEFIALQNDIRESDRDALQAANRIRYFGAAIADFDDTAALAGHCDVVVSVCTSVAHLAGGLGRPLWVLLDAIPDWRWLLDRADSPWYPSACLYRQGACGAWDEVLQRVVRDLDALARERRTLADPAAEDRQADA